MRYWVGRRLPSPTWALALCLLAATSCKAVGGDLNGRASDEWTRSYSIEGKGEVQIVNSNGTIEVEGVEGSKVEVRAERSARGATEAVARELLPRISIKEDVAPDRISIETERIAGLLIGASFSVDYHVRAPASALIRVRTANGSIAVERFGGRVVLNAVNGQITGRELSGGVEVRTVNGRVDITLRSIGDDPVELRTTNGPIELALPQNAKVSLTASTVNGPIDATALSLDLMGEQSRRRVRGRLNGGGTPIDLTTVNGGIHVTAR